MDKDKQMSTGTEQVIGDCYEFVRSAELSGHASAIAPSSTVSLRASRDPFLIYSDDQAQQASKIQSNALPINNKKKSRKLSHKKNCLEGDLHGPGLALRHASTQSSGSAFHHSLGCHASSTPTKGNASREALRPLKVPASDSLTSRHQIPIFSCRSQGLGRSRHFTDQDSSKDLQMAPDVSDGLTSDGSLRLLSLESHGSGLNLSDSVLDRDSSKELQVAVYHNASSDNSFHLSGSFVLDQASERDSSAKELQLASGSHHHDSSKSLDLLRLASNRSVGPRRASSVRLDASQLSDLSRMRQDSPEFAPYGSRTPLIALNTEFNDEPIADENHQTTVSPPARSSGILNDDISGLVTNRRVGSIQYAAVQVVSSPTSSQPFGCKSLLKKNKNVAVVIIVLLLIFASMAGMIFSMVGRAKHIVLSGMPSIEPTPSPSRFPSIQPSKSQQPSTSVSPTGSPWVVQSRIEGPSFGRSVQLTTELLVFSNMTYVFTYMWVNGEWIQSEQTLPGDHLVLSQTNRILVRDGLIVKAYDLVDGSWSRIGADIVIDRIYAESLAISGDGLTIAVSGVLPNRVLQRSYMFRYVYKERDWLEHGDYIETGAQPPSKFEQAVGTSFSYDGNVFALGVGSNETIWSELFRAPSGGRTYWPHFLHEMGGFNDGPNVVLPSGNETASIETFLAGTRGRARLWNATNREVLYEHTFFDESKAVPVVQLSSDGTIIAYAWERNLRVLERMGAVLEEKWLPSSAFGTIESLSFSSNAKLAVGQPDSNVVEVLATSADMQM